MDPLTVACPHCRAEVGMKCRNYLGKGKQPCPGRGEPPPSSWQGDLFGRGAQSVAVQGEMFPGEETARARTPEPADERQQGLFE